MCEQNELEDWGTCPECGGEGSVEVPHPQRNDPYYCDVHQCFTCGGSGWICN